MCNRTATVTFWLLVLYGVLCLLVSLVPHLGPPNFRYDGSDPTRDVLNFGWPLAMCIVDPKSGFHLGPFVVLIPIQLAGLGVLLILHLWATLRRRSGSPGGASRED